MKVLVLGGSALGSVIAAATLTSCGEAQPPVGAGAISGAHATAARLSRAGSSYNVADGLIFVADYGNSSGSYDDVKVYDVKKANPEPLATITDGVSAPQAACIDGHRTLYITSMPAGSGWISEYALGSTSPSKEITEGIDGPAFCAIDGDGNLWVTNFYGQNATEYLRGSITPHSVISGLTNPVGIAIDHAENIYIANNTNNGTAYVRVYRRGGKSPIRIISEGINWPIFGIGVDAAGTLYVTELLANVVEEYRFGKSKPYRTIPYGMNGPSAITLAGNGWAYVTNTHLAHGYGPPYVVLEFPPDSIKPSHKMIHKDLYAPEGTAYYPPLLPKT